MSEAPLEDLMVAMDVVDTVRHRDLIVDRELDGEARRGRLLERLREIYAAQGIEVSDAALEAGVDALEEERFSYTPTAGGFSATLARIYVRRGRWLRPLMLVLALGLTIWLAWFFMVELPERVRLGAIPAAMNRAHARIEAISQDADASARADDLLRRGRDAFADEKYKLAETAVGEIEKLQGELEATYIIRVVSRPGEASGVWRIPDVNEDARNFYLIVEAIDRRGNVVPVTVTSEENGRTSTVRKWGLRVSRELFESVAADKRDDGIIQAREIGEKTTGQWRPEYSVPTTGAAITEW